MHATQNKGSGDASGKDLVMTFSQPFCSSVWHKVRRVVSKSAVCTVRVWKDNEKCMIDCYWVVPEKIHTPPPMDGILEILAGVGGGGEGGSKTLEIQAGGGVELEKVLCRGHFNR